MVAYTYEIQALVNVDDDNFSGYRPEHPLAKVTGADGEPIRFIMLGHTPMDAANHFWAVGNKMAADVNGTRWPLDIRSLSVGDVITVRCHGILVQRHQDGTTSQVDPAATHSEEQAVLAVASIGFDALIEPPNRIVPIEGTWATSRK